jgi:phosphatidate cytidylyltransferase
MKLFGSHTERVVTGLGLIAGVSLIGYIDNFYLTWLILGGVYLLAFYEANTLFGIKNNSLYFYAALIWVVALFYPYGDDLFVIAGIVSASFMAYKNEKSWSEFLPFVYPTAGMLFTLSMYKEYGMIAMLWLLIAVAATDTGAYFVGKSIGKTPFSPTSPKKTMEGLVGGVVIATIMASYVGMQIVDIEKAVAISFLVSIASIFGDLFESSLKRHAGLKDSGSILPGHGGVLDRIDGYLFGAVVMLVLLRGIV